MTLGIPSESHPVENQPEALLGLAALMQMALSGVDMTALAQPLIDRAQTDPHDTNSLMDLAVVLQLTGSPEVALSVQAQALEQQRLYHLPCNSDQPAMRLLALMAPGELMANTPLEFLVMNTDISLDMLYLLPGEPLPDSVPDHDLLFVAVAESDANRLLLQQINTALQHWQRPVINRAEQIAQLSRNGVCALLKDAPGIDIPLSVRTGRETLEQIDRDARSITSILPDGNFPIIVRPIGSHAGRGLSKLEHPNAIAEYLRGMPEREFYAARFVDYRSADGLYRKYRIILIDGQPFVVHMAISEHWMIHYLNAGMSESASKREEEARFMRDFDVGFARRHAGVLQNITERVGLDYFGIDCAETSDGRLLVFEIDSALVVHAMDPVDLFPYKRPQMQKIFSAFRDMLDRRLNP